MKIEKPNTKIYWIAENAPVYGFTEINQVTESAFEMITYESKEDWIYDLSILGIDYETIEIEKD